MKTFDEKDLITWANRDKAVIGNEYYFADSLDAMECYINNEPSRKLIIINKNSCSYTFENSHHNYYAYILPVDAVKEPEKKYRACKTIQEFCKLVTSNTTIQPDGQCSLIGCIVHIRNKITDTKRSIIPIYCRLTIFKLEIEKLNHSPKPRDEFGFSILYTFFFKKT